MTGYMYVVVEVAIDFVFTKDSILFHWLSVSENERTNAH